MYRATLDVNGACLGYTVSMCGLGRGGAGVRFEARGARDCGLMSGRLIPTHTCTGPEA